MELTANSFTKLLAASERGGREVGEGYEDLRRTLIRFFEWRGAPFPEEHADVSLNRIARKLDEGTDQKYRWLLLSSRAA
jgi:hypothetical protein